MLLLVWPCPLPQIIGGLRAHEEKRPIPSQREKVGPFLRRWLDKVAKPTLRASTYSSYDDILGGHLIPGLGHIALVKLTPAEVQAFLNRKLAAGLSPRRVQYIHAVLRRGPQYCGTLGHGGPKRRQARRPAEGAQA